MSDSDGKNEQYGYDNNDNRTTWTRTNGVTFTYSYDGLNRVTARTGTANVSAARWGYDLVGRKTLEAAGSASTSPGEVYVYDKAGRMTSSVVSLGTGSALTTGFGYDASGNRTSVTYPSGASAAYVYDALNRMHTISWGGTLMATYGYDTASERVSLVYNNSTSMGYQYNPSGWLTTQTNSYSPALQIGFGYDHSGHVTGESYSASGYEWAPVAGTESAPSTGWSYRFDDLGRMISAANSNTGVSTSFTIDADNIRMSKAATSATTTYVTVGGQTFADYNGSGTLLNQYVYGPGHQVVAMQNVSSGTWSWLHQDQRGSTIATTNSTGTVTQAYAYDPYGQSTSTAGVPFLYTGHRYDAETGLYFTPARSYDPVAGEWISADPTGTKDGVNSFLYVHADPVNGTDPSGTEDVDSSDWKKGLVKTTGSRLDQAPGSAPGSTAENNGGMQPKEGSKQTASTGTTAEGTPGNGSPMVSGVGGGLGVIAAGACDVATEGVCTPADPWIVGAVAAGTVATAEALNSISHGNSLDSSRQTYVYQLVQSGTDEVLKYGITSEVNPYSRYTASEYSKWNADMQILGLYPTRLMARVEELRLNGNYVMQNGSFPPMTFRW